MTHRYTIDTLKYAPEAARLTEMIALADLDQPARVRIAAKGADLVRQIRASSDPGLMEVFLAEYGLSTDEGIALMCLAEALLRVPDADTIDALIEDKIAPSDWGRHKGQSTSALVNASTWALMLTGKVLEDAEPGVLGTLRGAVKRLGEPVIRTATARAMKEMGAQFVLGETIEKAMKRGSAMEEKGYTYSYDMLGEAARTDADARRYQMAYANAISEIAANCTSDDIRENPGISVKLSALHPRYERTQVDRVMAELVPRVSALVQLAKAGNMGFNIDAEEADRLSLSLDVIEKVLSDPALAGWDGFGVVVQAYGQRTSAVLDQLYDLATRLDRKIMVRLVKGAYWDTEVKLAQVEGLDAFPVYTSKSATDVSYIANARKLLAMTDRIYPQFATHNAHTAAAILDMAGSGDTDKSSFEFQRLHGMGERLHDIILSGEGTRCRIYAPVGAHRNLLAYLVRRLLENGANSSFVNQIVDEDVPPEEVASCPFAALEQAHPHIPTGTELFAPTRANSKGVDLTHDPHLEAIEAARAPFRETQFAAAPLIAGKVEGADPWTVTNPSTGATVGRLTPCSAADVETALAAATRWDADPATRAEVLKKAAELYEAHLGPFFALLAREAGKTLLDCQGELREAVDFLRYYASRIPTLDTEARGIFACISPWNFPLAIFTGQIAGALAAGNGVLAKPAESTGLIAHEAAKLLHQAGVPREVLQLLPGKGSVVGAAITSDKRVNGVAFTGSTETAQIIRRAMADNLAPDAPLIAETGGLNAMIVDSTALPEQAVRDVLASSFQSAGQRCSALRCLYIQEDIADSFLTMLKGAMSELRQGDPWEITTDLGPVIDQTAFDGIASYVSGRETLFVNTPPEGGLFIPPTTISVSGINDLEREVFGPVLHVARFKSENLDRVIDDINGRGYGLTFGLHTRIDDRVQYIADRLHVGNTYVNRNQIGAVVGSQPFGGEGLSGTGPKAGGPDYLRRFCVDDRPEAGPIDGARMDLTDVTAALAQVTPPPGVITTQDLPGPTGELNRLTTTPRPPFLCMGPGAAAQAQLKAVEAAGGQAVLADRMPPHHLETLHEIGGVIWWGDEDTARDIAQALAARPGAILPLITGTPRADHVLSERHLCVDTTASGGNAELLAASA